MFFAKLGEYEPSGIYNTNHLILVVITITLILIALKFTKNKNEEQIRKIIIICTIVMWFLEILKIIFKLQQCTFKDVNRYVPLYYCSILLYAGILSSFCKGKLKRLGDVFFATGGIIGGIVYLIFPTTSLPEYPVFHFLTFYSFLFHGVMIYIGLLMNITGYIKLKKQDIIYYAGLVGIICILALIVNNIFDSNLMFISQNFPGMPLEKIYNATGFLFTPIMIMLQITLPFMIMYVLLKIFQNKIKNIDK